MSKPIVFVSYSHKDEEWKDRLVTHLGVLYHQGRLVLWDDSRIGVGEDWYQEIQEAMTAASVAVLLVSANFLNSKFILSEEVPRLLERREKEGLYIVPVIVRPCAWKQVKWLARMQVRPKDGQPLSAGDEYQIDTALTVIAEEVGAIIDRVARLPKHLLDSAFAQLPEEYDTALGKMVRVKEGSGFDPSVSSPSLDWRFSHYELAVRLHPESFIYVEVLDEKGEKHKLLYSSAILFGLNRWGELHIPLDKDVSETWHSLMIDLPEHMEQAHWSGFVKVNRLFLRGEVSLAEIRGCDDGGSLKESATASLYTVRFPVLQTSKLPQILLDFASSPSLEGWENSGFRKLEYDTTLGKRVLVKKGRGSNSVVSSPSVDWEPTRYYDLTVRLHPDSAICISVLDKTDRNRTLIYTSTIVPKVNERDEFHILLDRDISDGTWHSLMIDLPEHMEQAHWPDFVKVNWLQLRGEVELAGIRGCDDKDPLIESAIASKYDVHFPILAVNDTLRPDSAPSSKDPATFVPYVISNNRIDLVGTDDLLNVSRSPQDAHELILWLSVEDPDKASAMIGEIGPDLLESLSDSPRDVRVLFSALQNQSPSIGKLLASVITSRFKTQMAKKSPEDWGETQLILQRLRAEAKEIKRKEKPAAQGVWDVFISHAWEDKRDIARPLAEALRREGLRVWYDEFTLRVGDKLRRSIDRGLTDSRYGVVILSPNFFAKEWPQKELDGLAAREVHGEKVILPVWHNVAAEQVREYSPTLADRVAVSSDRGLDHVVEELLLVIKLTKNELIERRSPSMAKEMRQHRWEKLSLERIANDPGPLEKRYPGLPLGEGHFNGVPFVLSTEFFSIHRMPARADTIELRLDKPLERVSSVHVLIIGGNVYKQRQGTSLEDVTIGRIQLIFHDKSSQEPKKLIVGENIREWVPGNRPGELVDSVTEQLCQVAWRGKDSSGKEIFIDHLEIQVQEQHRRKALERILIFRDVRPNTPEGDLSFSIFAITLECW